MSAQNSRSGTVFGALLGTVAFSALAGVLVAVLVTPAIAIAGATVNNSIGIFDSLPDFIEIDQQTQQNRIFATRDGQPVQVATIFDQNREEVAWDQVSQFAKDAAISGEDKRYYEHGGVDLQGIVRAAVKNVAAGGISEGASTITQQYVKNTFIQAALEAPTVEEQKKLYNDAVDPKFDRKLKEMKLAISLEKRHSKDDILLAYLNIANFGGNTYGIEAAAKRYFSTNAANLTVAQAASLIATVQSPGVFRLDDPENYAGNQGRRDVIINAMYGEGKITPEQRAEALATPLEGTVAVAVPNNGCMAADPNATYFCDYVRNLVRDLPALGADTTAREAAFKHGGYDIYTTLDLNLQTVAQDANAANAPPDTTALQLGSASVSVEVGTGRILVMAQNKAFDNTKDGGGNATTALNFNTDKAYGGSSGFQPGSTYKVFTLLNWLQNGHGINEVVNGNARTEPQAKFVDSCGGPWFGPYAFTNDANEKGNMTVRNATEQSVNGAFISMALKLDVCAIRDTAASIGVHRADGAELETNPSSVLGTNQIAPLSMAAAYAAIASGGTYCAPIAIDKIIGPDDAELPGQPQDCSKRLEPDVANTAAFAMAGVMVGRGSGIRSNPKDGVEFIGKTGTTNDSNQTWVVTSNTRVATAVWVGNVVGKYPIRKFKNTKGIGGGYIRHDIMRSILTAIDKTAYRGGEFPEPAKALLSGSGKTMPELAGKTVDAATSILQGLGFKVTVGAAEDSSLERGLVVRSNPSVGNLVSRNSNVTLFTSNGALTTIPNVAGDGKVKPDDARQALQDAGFETIGADSCTVTAPVDPGKPTDEEKEKDGRVVGTTPAEGTALRKTDPVSLVVGKASC